MTSSSPAAAAAAPSLSCTSTTFVMSLMLQCPKVTKKRVAVYRADAQVQRPQLLARLADYQKYAAAKLNLELQRLSAEKSKLSGEALKVFMESPMTDEQQLRSYQVEYTRRLMYDQHIKELFLGRHYYTRSVTTINQAVVLFQRHTTRKEDLVAALYAIFPQTPIWKRTPLKWTKQSRKREFAIDLWVRLDTILSHHTSLPPFFEKEIIAHTLRQFDFMHKSTVRYADTLPVLTSPARTAPVP